MNQQQKAQQYQTKLKAKMYDLQQQLATKSAFLEYYYKILKNCKTQKAAFDVVSLMYYKLFKEYLFNSFDAFRMYKNKNLKK